MPPVGERVTYLPKPEKLTFERRVMISEEAQKIAGHMPLLAPPQEYAPSPPQGPDGILLCPQRWVSTTSATARYTLDNRPGITFSAHVEMDANQDHWLEITSSKNETGEEWFGLAMGLARHPDSDSRWLSGLHIPGGQDFTFEQWLDAMQNIQETLDLIEKANIEQYGMSNLKDGLGISAGLSKEQVSARRAELRSLQRQLDPLLNYPTAEELAAAARKRR